MKNSLHIAIVGFTLICVGSFSGAQEFSADIVYAASDKGATALKTPAAPPATPHDPSKIYVSGKKMRLETRGLTGTILIVDAEKAAVVALFPIKKAYQPLASGPSEYFHVDDAEDACPAWQKAAQRQLACEKAGHETLAGRDAVKYVNKTASPAAPVSALWVDPALNFVVKWQDSTSGAELQNITKEERLPPALFEIPQGFDQLKPKKKGPKSGTPGK